MFVKDTQYMDHMRVEHTWGIYNCEVCDMIAHYPKDITGHVRNFHPDKAMVSK